MNLMLPATYRVANLTMRCGDGVVNWRSSLYEGDVEGEVCAGQRHLASEDRLVLVEQRGRAGDVVVREIAQVWSFDG